MACSFGECNKANCSSCSSACNHSSSAASRLWAASSQAIKPPRTCTLRSSGQYPASQACGVASHMQKFFHYRKESRAGLRTEEPRGTSGETSAHLQWKRGQSAPRAHCGARVYQLPRSCAGDTIHIKRGRPERRAPTGRSARGDAAWFPWGSVCLWQAPSSIPVGTARYGTNRRPRRRGGGFC